MTRRERKRLAVLLAAAAIGLWWDNYHQIVWLTTCEFVSSHSGGYVVVDGGLEESGTAIFYKDGPRLKPWLLGLAFAPDYRNMPRVRRSGWGWKYHMLSVDLQYGEDPPYRQNLGRIDEACWRTLTQYLRDTPHARGVEIIDER